MAGQAHDPGSTVGRPSIANAGGKSVFVRHESLVGIHAGAGVVADSVPINEYEETRNKARGMMKALALAKHYHAARMAGEES